MSGAVFEVDPGEVDTAGRIGLFFQLKAEVLAALIARDGQRTPINVAKKGGGKPGWKLVAGLHRLEACRIAGVPCQALEVSGDADALGAIQASENLDRREMAPLERAMFVAEVAMAAQRRVLAASDVTNLHAAAAKAKAAKVQFTAAQKADDEGRVAVDNLSSAYSWKPEVAEACGLGLKDVQRALRIFRCVVEPNRDLMDAFKDHRVAQRSGDLLELAGIADAAIRRRAIEVMIGGPGELGLVLQMLGLKALPSQPSDFDKFSNQAIGAAKRLSAGEWKRFCPQFVQSLSPARQAELRSALSVTEEPS